MNIIFWQWPSRKGASSKTGLRADTVLVKSYLIWALADHVITLAQTINGAYPIIQPTQRSQSLPKLL